VLACASVLGACVRGREGTPYAWQQRAAAHYLDRREARWAAWDGAARDEGTFCVSCHTSLSYALARPVIDVPDDGAGTAEGAQLVQDVRKRVRRWQQIGPYYRGKDQESRGTESVLNALILATHDARDGGSLSADAQSAFTYMWELQHTSGEDRGAWSWLEFRQEPWEAPDSVYYGACLAALAVGTAPEAYRDTATIQPNLALLRDYLDRSYGAQTTINQVTLLWASSRWPALIDTGTRRAITEKIFSEQRPDGGWSLSTLAGSWKRTDGTPLVLESDGYATGLISYVLQESGVPRDNAHLDRGLKWLSKNQSWIDGHWSAYSPNKRRHNPFSNVSQFMNDAATAYAALALAKADSPDRATAQTVDSAVR